MLNNISGIDFDKSTNFIISCSCDSSIKFIIRDVVYQF